MRPEPLTREACETYETYLRGVGYDDQLTAGTLVLTVCTCGAPVCRGWKLTAATPLIESSPAD